MIRSEKALPIYLLNMGQQECQDHITRADGYPCHQILYCTKGSGVLLLNGEKIFITPYTAIFLPAFCPHEYYPDGNVWDIHWVVMAGYAIDSVLEHFSLSDPGIYMLENIKMLEHIFRKMHDAIRADSFFGNYTASGYLYDFLIEFYRIITVKSAVNKPNPALLKAIDYINCYYTHAISMEELCKAAKVSNQYLCSLFKKTLNTRPMEYIAKRRIQAAKELLTGSAKTIEQIAAETGFCTSSYFCKLFKRYEGITPAQFKNIN